MQLSDKFQRYTAQSSAYGLGTFLVTWSFLPTLIVLLQCLRFLHLCSFDHFLKGLCEFFWINYHLIMFKQIKATPASFSSTPIKFE